MRLEDFQPVSHLEVPRTKVETPKFAVTDMHTHWGELLMGEDFPEQYDTAAVVADLKAHGVRKVVNLDLGFGAQRQKMLDKEAGYEDFFINFGTVDVSRFEEPDFAKQAEDSIKDGMRHYGMAGVKLWKPIGLGFQDSKGAYLRPDDPRLSPIFDTAAEEGIPVLFHIADPAAFFDPIDEHNERWEELGVHSVWSFSDPKFYRFRELMAMQENLIEAHPDTTFIIAHVGSYSENLRKVASWLDRFPNMYVDIAARIAEMGRQPYTAKWFLETYSERIFFGTDFVPVDRVFHPNYYRFLETMDEYFSPEGDGYPLTQGRWNIYGVGLSDKALKDIYQDNAERVFGF